jgi:membrane fusion protein (multidrug efflux system)
METPAPAHAPAPAIPATPQHARPRRRWLYAGGLVVLIAAAYFLVPAVVTAFTTASTDDAFVNGHVTFVAPRVGGQVNEVFVDDNMPVAKGQRLVELDKEPYRVQVSIKEAVVEVARADLKAAIAQVRAVEGILRGTRWKVQNAIEQVDNQIANLKVLVATLRSKEAQLVKARKDYARATQAARTSPGTVSPEEIDSLKAAVDVGEAAVAEAQENIARQRVSLGLPHKSESGDPTQVPDKLDQNFSSVRSALAELAQYAAQLGLELPGTNDTPQQVIDNFRKRDSRGDIDRVLENIVKEAPAVKQAEAKLMQAEADLAQAKLNLRYCDILAEIDGVVLRRNVNPGNNVAVGQSLMALRSLTDIWIDANFKETQLAELRVGHPVDIYADVYGSRHVYKGRVSGFTMGTGQTLALLPPQNATGNFVKVVQRLPVRIDLIDYDPTVNPLFVGVSVVPYVHYKQETTGPHAGEVLQRRPAGPGR